MLDLINDESAERRCRSEALGNRGESSIRAQLLNGRTADACTTSGSQCFKLPRSSRICCRRYNPIVF